MANIYAEIFYKIFKKSFLDDTHKSTTKETSSKFAPFIKDFSSFLEKTETPTDKKLSLEGYYIPDKEFFHFILSLRATMIAYAKYLPDLSVKNSRDPKLIEFLDKTKDFCLSLSPKLTEDFDYNVFQLDHTTQHLRVKEDDTKPQNKNIFVFGVNRLNLKKEQDVDYAFKHSTKDLFKEKLFAVHDIFSVTMPTCFPEEIAASTLLKTITNPKEVHDFDRYFTEEYWGHFVGKDIEYNEDGTLKTGSPYTPEELKNNLKNLKIFSYCAGAANAHRCLNALKNIALQLYEPDVVKDAWKNIDVISYAFPLESEKIDYHCVAMMCNEKNPDNPEAVVLTNFPDFYRQNALKENSLQNINIKDENSCKYICLELPKDVQMFDHEGNAISREINNRNGHRLQNITYDNPHSPNFKILCYIWYQLLHNKKINNNVLMSLSGQGLPGNANQRY